MEYTQGQSTAGIPFKMLSRFDGVSPLPGLSPVVQLSKNGSALANAAGSVVAIGGGAYYVQPNAADFNTLGSLTLVATDPSGQGFADPDTSNSVVPA